MSIDYSPLSDYRTGVDTLSWELDFSVCRLHVTVRGVRPAAIEGIEHDLCALMALLELYLGHEPFQSRFGVKTQRWEISIVANGDASSALEREICKRLKRLNQLIDLGSNERIRPTVDYLP